MSDNQNNDNQIIKSKAGKYLTFKLASEEYGLEILKVREIIGLMNITPVPRAPEHIRGVINLRGKIIPVLDMRRLFGLEELPDTPETCIVVVDVDLQGKSVLMGTVVDAVLEVLSIREDEIENAPAFGENMDTRFILGVAKVKNNVKILLDIDETLSIHDSSILSNFVDSCKEVVTNGESAPITA